MSGNHAARQETEIFGSQLLCLYNGGLMIVGPCRFDDKMWAKERNQRPATDALQMSRREMEELAIAVASQKLRRYAFCLESKKSVSTIGVTGGRHFCELYRSLPFTILMERALSLGCMMRLRPAWRQQRKNARNWVTAVVKSSQRTLRFARRSTWHSWRRCDDGSLGHRPEMLIS